MTDNTSQVPLTIRLHELSAYAPQGRPVRAAGDVEASLRMDAAEMVLTMGLPDRPRADLRWAVDRVVRQVRSLGPVGAAGIEASDAIADETVLTLALDAHHWSQGRASVSGRPHLEARRARIAAAEDGCRAWVNEDPSTRTSIAIARDVETWSEGRPGVSVEILGESELRRQGLRLLLAVGNASLDSPPRLVVASWTPPGTPEGTAPRMLLGKGITFDSGGLNVKPYESYVSHMKNDMAGAALAWWLFRTLVEAESPTPLVVVLPTCENAIGPRSMRPGALVRSYRGPMVRIDHTDAEGRLALADGLAWATDRFAPREVLSFATLTTAALIAYGPYATPVHFAGTEMQAALRAAAEGTGEDLHFFPERVWHFEANRDQEADLRNTARLPGNASRGAGSRNAAHFLKHFTDTPLVHFDIFASAWNWAGDAPGAGYGATGSPLRTLLQALES